MKSQARHKTDGCLLGWLGKTAAPSLCQGPAPWKAQGGEHGVCHGVLNSSGSYAFMGCFSYFRTWLTGFSWYISSFLGVSTHLWNPYPLVLCNNMEAYEVGKQVRPGLSPEQVPWVLLASSEKWENNELLKEGPLTHEDHFTQCLTHENWVAS